MSNRRKRRNRPSLQKDQKKEEEKEEIQNVDSESKETEVEEVKKESQVHQEEILDESDDQNVDFSTPCLDVNTFLGGAFKKLLGGKNIMTNAAQQQINPFTQMSNPAIPVQAQQQQVPVQQQPVQTQVPVQQVQAPIQQVPVQQQPVQTQVPVQQQPVQTQVPVQQAQAPIQQVPVQQQPQMQVIQQNPVQNAQNMSALLSAYSALPNAATNQVPDNVKNMIKSEGYGEVIAKIQNLSPEKQQIAFMLLQEANTGKKLITDEQADKAVELLDINNDEDDDSWTTKDYLMAGGAAAVAGGVAYLAYNHFKEDDVSDVIETSGEALNTLSKYVSFS